MRTPTLLLFFGFLLVACGDDGNEADRRGVGASCVTSEDCFEEGQECLTDFSGGYCGNSGCTAHADCPAGSSCVVHDDGLNYCFRNCDEKPECNTHREEDVESNCSSSVDYVEPLLPGSAPKACIPPSSGT